MQIGVAAGLVFGLASHILALSTNSSDISLTLRSEAEGVHSCYPLRGVMK
jgi:hypothetical protein